MCGLAAAHDKNEQLEAALRASEENTKNAEGQIKVLLEQVQSLEDEIAHRESDRQRQLKQIRKLQGELDDHLSNYAVIKMRAGLSEQVLTAQKDQVNACCCGFVVVVFCSSSRGWQVAGCVCARHVCMMC